MVSDWASLNIRQPTGDEQDVMSTWWENNLRHLTLKRQRSVAAVLMITARCLCTKSNRRIFEHRSLTPIQVFSLVKAELLQRVTACGRPELDVVPFVSNV